MGNVGNSWFWIGSRYDNLVCSLSETRRTDTAGSNRPQYAIQHFPCSCTISGCHFGRKRTICLLWQIHPHLNSGHRYGSTAKNQHKLNHTFSWRFLVTSEDVSAALCTCHVIDRLWTPLWGLISRGCCLRMASKLLEWHGPLLYIKSFRLPVARLYADDRRSVFLPFSGHVLDAVLR